MGNMELGILIGTKCLKTGALFLSIFLWLGVAQGTPSRMTTGKSDVDTTSLPPHQLQLLEHLLHRMQHGAYLRRVPRSTPSPLYVDVNSSCSNATGDSTTSTTSPGAVVDPDASCTWRTSTETDYNRIPREIICARPETDECKLEVNADIVDGECGAINTNQEVWMRHGCYEGHNAYVAESKSIVVGFYCKKKVD